MSSFPVSAQKHLDGSDAWYYAEGQTQRGPVTLAELSTALVRTASQPKTVMIWRPGLDAWQPAGKVAEVSAALASNAKLTGIGGWLILIAIGQVAVPFRMVVNLTGYYVTTDRDIFQQYQVAAAGELSINLALLVLVVTTSILFFSRSKRFPMFFICELVAFALLAPISMAWTSLTLSVESGLPAETILMAMLSPWAITRQVLALISCAVWTAYVLKSRRVANTFVN
jgi:uncharacterized protein DUF2569/uncharacterized protein DUF4339